MIQRWEAAVYVSKPFAQSLPPPPPPFFFFLSFSFYLNFCWCNLLIHVSMITVRSVWYVKKREKLKSKKRKLVPYWDIQTLNDYNRNVTSFKPTRKCQEAHAGTHSVSGIWGEKLGRYTVIPFSFRWIKSGIQERLDRTVYISNWHLCGFRWHISTCETPTLRVFQWRGVPVTLMYAQVRTGLCI